MSHTRMILGGPCSYCSTARSVHTDHIVSKNDRRRYGIAKNDARYHAPACPSCNWHKLDSRVVPPTHAHLVDELNARMAGTRWRVWNGDPAMLGAA
jgi:hypothetical protein